ncbi:MAG: hypothetical protein IK012_07730 [Fibrobacter sp.]|uniref:hypothetical protein n=1 Tax=Fibrobacter sp. TaxID=35828 RepID=UPI0025BE454C|nr:hypothetical protein [Fibrobacter sp.]MBR4785127.1 hypothetical protein [Fibrobacter sp.]
MFKKIILASMLAVVSSFADEDEYKVLEAHKGRVSFGTSYRTYEVRDVNYHLVDIGVNARYTVIQNLELALDIPYRVFNYWSGNDDYMVGFGNLSFSAAYQFISKMNVFAGVSAPVEDLSNDAWTFNAGLRFSTEINRLIDFGALLGVVSATKGKDDYVPVVGVADAKLFFNVTPQFTPFVGMTFNFQEQIPVYDSKRLHSRESIYFGSSVGADYKFNDVVGINATVGLHRYFGLGDLPSFFIADAAFHVFVYF